MPVRVNRRGEKAEPLFLYMLYNLVEGHCFLESKCCNNQATLDARAPLKLSAVRFGQLKHSALFHHLVYYSSKYRISNMGALSSEFE
jgi:hypothetical protein